MEQAVVVVQPSHAQAIGLSSPVVRYFLDGLRKLVPQLVHHITVQNGGRVLQKVIPLHILNPKLVDNQGLGMIDL